jgi:hypothetical protein
VLPHYDDRQQGPKGMDKKVMETPLAESSVSLNLEMIQKRCSELMDNPDAMLELAIDEPASEDPRASDPYNFQRS